MSEVSVSSRRASLCDKRLKEKWIMLAGDCEMINNHLESKLDQSIWGLLKFLNSVLRSFGQVLTANNPVSGFFIMLAIAVADYKAFLSGLMTSSLAFVFAMLLQQDPTANLNGLFGYNPVLHGVVSVGLLPYFYNIDISEPKFWLFLIFTTFLSVYVTSASFNFFQYLGRFPVHCFTLPFNLLQFLLIFSLLHNSIPSKILSNHLIEAPGMNLTKPSEPLMPVLPPTNSTLIVNLRESLENVVENNRRKRKSHGRKNPNKETERKGRDRIWTRSVQEVEIKENITLEEITNRTDHLNWGKVFSGTIVAASQVYGLNHIPCAVLIYLAILIYSPTTAAFSYVGSILGTLTGTFFAVSPQDVYEGIWGYNGLLCAASLGGFGFVLTLQSAILTLTAVLFSTGLQHFLAPLFVQFNVPMLLMPYNITTILFLFVTSGNDRALARPSILSFPEKHREEYNNVSSEHLEGYLRRVRLGEIFASKDEV